MKTIDAEFAKDDTRWFDTCGTVCDIRMIADLNGGLPISEFGCSHPIWIYDASRADTGYDRRKAKQLRRRYE